MLNASLVITKEDKINNEDELCNYEAFLSSKVITI